VAVKGRGPQLVLPALAAMSMMVLLGASACSGKESEYYANCVDPHTGQVVDQSYCNDNPDYYIWMARQSYIPGYRVPVSARSGAGWFRSDDAAARANAGLPETGEVPDGFRVVSRSGGFDSAHVGSGGEDGHGGGGEGGHGSGGE
jgi:hypothetical protein